MLRLSRLTVKHRCQSKVEISQEEYDFSKRVSNPWLRRSALGVCFFSDL
jgi:hypothetical protein